MTEAEWLACEDPEAKLIYSRDRRDLTRMTVGRKLLLFTVACAREELERAKSLQEYFNLGERLTDHHEHYMDPEYGYEAAILIAERRADGAEGEPSNGRTLWLVGMSCKGSDLAFAALGYDPDGLVQIPPERIAETIRSYHVHPSRYVHDIFGNPFRPVAFAPE